MFYQVWGFCSKKWRNNSLRLSCFLIAFLFLTFLSKEIFADSSPFNLLDSNIQRGVFNIGQAQGHISRSPDEKNKKDVLKFDYSVPATSIIGVWTKNFPTNIEASSVDAINIGVNVLTPIQTRQISVRVEVKGSNSVQNISIPLQTGWNSVQALIDWNTVGVLREVVFVVSPNTGKEEVKGTLCFDVDFKKLSFFQKTFAFGKVGLVFILSLFLAFIVAFLGKLFVRNNEIKQVSTGFKRDLLYGTAAVLIAGLIFSIYSIGTIGTLDSSLIFLILGLVGAVVAEFLKLGLTGKHLTASEVFQNVFLTGLLAATSSSQELLQAPANWSQMLMKSNLTAAVACLVYHFSNAYLLASSGRHIKFFTGTLIVLTPYLFGWLLVLENLGLIQNLGNSITGGVLASCPNTLEYLGRFIIVFIFNEIVSNGIGLAVKGTTLKTFKSHAYLFLVSLGVVLSPLIANLGSTKFVADLPVFIKAVVGILTTIFSQAGLWAEIYLITGMILDCTHSIAPSSGTISHHVTSGTKKGMAYSGIFMALLYLLNISLNAPMLQKFMTALPLVVGSIFGALLFPLMKTIIESFDGSQGFFGRLKYSYKNFILYFRGAVFGFGLAYGITQGIFQREMSDRVLFGLFIGLFSSAGISILRDIVFSLKEQGRIQSWRVYLVDALLGGFVGSAVAFYLDSSQVPVIIQKFKLYNSSGLSPETYTIYPLVSKWGRIDLGTYTGGVKLLFNEALAGVISWSVAAWLFAINRVFLEALIKKDKSPIKTFFSKQGFLDLIKHMIHVLRWGLWMSPIISTFLRMMGEPTWYNQDGAVRTVVAIYNNITMDSSHFQAWSLNMFISLLAYDFVRIIIWLDHMGLRVATLVNLSFLGMDKLDDKVARFIGKSSTQRYIPEAIKRFTTWAPLLLPFYIPRGQAWDYAWNTAKEMQASANQCSLVVMVRSFSVSQIFLTIALAIIVSTGISFVIRYFARRCSKCCNQSLKISNREYKVFVKNNGEVESLVLHKGYDISRRAYDTIDPSGRTFYLVDTDQNIESQYRSWPVIGNFPKDKFLESCIEKKDESIKITNCSNGIRTVIDISLPENDDAAEIWSVTIENLTNSPRQLKMVPYLEWILAKGDDDRFHTQYARLFPEMEYVNEANAVLAWHRNTKSMGILACENSPEGFLSSRVDFIGRAHSIWSPRVLETLDFLPAKDTAAYPTFDPIGSLMVNIKLNPNSSKTTRFMIGYAKNKESATDMVKKYLKPVVIKSLSLKEKNKSYLIGHGEILPGTPQPYYSYADDGKKIIIHTPYTPRPFDHAMSNAKGHFVVVTNRGLHTTSNGNSQQNRITPDCPDTVTREIPGEAIYLYDIDRAEWYSPTHHPLNDYSAKNEVEFGVDGTAVFKMTNKTISTQLTVFVPPEETLGVYILKIKNNADYARRMRIAPYFQIVLAGQPEWAGSLDVKKDKNLSALFFENPRNTFRTGPAFVSMSLKAEKIETRRGKFFGKDRGVSNPFMVERGKSDCEEKSDSRPVAGLVGTIEIPAHGETEIVVVLGQTDNRKKAKELILKYKNVEQAKKSLDETRAWWLGLMKTVKVSTNNPEFDQFQNWLKYQAVAERLWARRGFYQSSGAFGFRDQLQDSVNLIWVDPKLARKQILLHASQQFIEGDVVHWFHTLHDGRTAFANRSHASDNLLWLPWGVVEYVRTTGDESILKERTSYLKSETPFLALPKNKHGWGTIYHRSAKEDSVYRHCLKSIDLVLEKRMGERGLPLIGTGDWNDGLDEIGSQGKGESTWLGFFLYYILNNMLDIIEKTDGKARREHYSKKMKELRDALERTWRDDRYLRAIYDDGTEIGIKGSGVWEIDALTASWAIKAGINFERGVKIFNTALEVLEKEKTILLGWPALREDTKPYLGRSSHYPEGVRENGMYCHGVQWLVRAARILAEEFEKKGNESKATEYRKIAYRLWMKISPITHVAGQEIEIYGGQPNKQSADMLTTFDQGRMIWNGYTGAAGWMLRQAFEGVVGASLVNNKVVMPDDIDKPRGDLKVKSVNRDTSVSPIKI